MSAIFRNRTMRAAPFLLAVVLVGAPAIAAERIDTPTAAEKRHIQKLLAPDGARPAKARRANPVINGAIVCRDLLATVEMVTAQLTDAATDHMVSVMTEGKSERTRRATPAPNLAQFGCAFLPAGTPVTVEENDPAPVIRGETLLGVTVYGVTHPAMIEFDEAPPR